MICQILFFSKKKNYLQRRLQNLPREWCRLTLVLLVRIYPAFANSVDPDQLASEEANWSGSALFVIKNMNLYQQPGSSNLIGWKLEKGLASLIIQHGKG